MINYGYGRLSSPPDYPLLEDDNTEVRNQWPHFFNIKIEENKLMKDAKGNPLKYVLFFDNNDKNNNRYIKLI
jgi:hypothetical protein